MDHESARNNIRKMDTETLWSLLANYERIGEYITIEQLSANLMVIKELIKRNGHAGN
jgi:hypothetical protein